MNKKTLTLFYVVHVTLYTYNSYLKAQTFYSLECKNFNYFLGEKRPLKTVLYSRLD